MDEKPPPHQTGRAVFPHPAFPVDSSSCYRNQHLSSHSDKASFFSKKLSGFPGHRTIRFLCKRLSHLLNQHTTGRVPLLHGHCPASTLLRTPPTPHRQGMRFILPHPLSSLDLQPAGSPKFRVKLSSRAIRYHPEEPNKCMHLSLPCPCWLYHSRKAGHSRFSFTRLEPVHFRYGSRLCSTELRRLRCLRRRLLHYMFDRYFT